MSASAPQPPAGADRVDPNGVRTYRGRTIEELIPRIRADLGPDAIILREREGLTGGIGGFFAQRCVEIDARPAPRISLYDDDDELADWEDLGGEPEDEADPYDEPEPAAAYSPEPVRPYTPQTPVAPYQEPAIPAPVSPTADQIVRPGVESLAEPAGHAPFLDEASFAARLEEATYAAGEAAPAVQPEAAATEPAAVQSAPPAPPTFIAFDELGEPDAEPEPFAAPVEPDAAPVEPDATPVEPDATALEPDAAPVEPDAAPVVASPPAPQPLAPAPWLRFAEQDDAAPVPTGAPATTAAPPPAVPAHPQPAGPSPVQASAATVSAASASPYGYGVRRRGGLLPAAERMLRAALDAASAANERREHEHRTRVSAPWPERPAPTPFGPAHPSPSQSSFAGPAPTPFKPERSEAPTPTPFPASVSSPAPPGDPATAPTAPEAAPEAAPLGEVAELERRLIASGMSPGNAAALVLATVSRGGPLAGPEALTRELRSTVVASLPVPRPIPSTHGAIAVVGAGGSGKTRAVAALAVSLARGGALVSVASLGAPGREDELGSLLRGEPVNVIPAMRTRATARAVASARDRGVVVIDTAAVAPGDSATIDVIAEAIDGFGLDGVYLAVPATVNLGAATRLVDGFSAFDLTGMIGTHLDESEQLGVLAELAGATGLPLGYTLRGGRLAEAITTAEPEWVAAQLV